MDAFKGNLFSFVQSVATGEIILWLRGRGQHGTVVDILTFGPSCAGFSYQNFQNTFRGKFDAVRVNQLHRWLEEIGQQMLYDVNRNHHVLASGKPVEQRS